MGKSIHPNVPIIFIASFSVACLITMYVLYGNLKQHHSMTQQEKELEEGVVELRDISDLNADTFRHLFGRNALFTVVASDKAVLTPRQVCSIESFSSLNHKYRVVVVFIKPIKQLRFDENKALSNLVTSNQHIDLVTVDPAEFFNDTAFEELDPSGLQDPVVMSSLLRVALVSKLGGNYMDMDFVHVGNMEQFLELHPLYVAPASDCAMSDFFFGFVHGHPFLVRVMEKMNENIQSGDLMSVQTAFGKIVEEESGVTLTSAIKNKAAGKIYIPPVETVSPVSSANFSVLYESASSSAIKALVKNSYACHFWGSKSTQIHLALDSASPYMTLAKKYCPRAVSVCASEF